MLDTNFYSVTHGAPVITLCKYVGCTAFLSLLHQGHFSISLKALCNNTKVFVKGILSLAYFSKICLAHNILNCSRVQLRGSSPLHPCSKGVRGLFLHPLLFSTICRVSRDGFTEERWDPYGRQYGEVIKVNDKYR